MPAYTLPAGDAFSLKVPLLINGAASPVAGWQVWFAVLRTENQTDAEAIVLAALGDGISVYDANTWLLELTAAQRAACREAARLNYYYFIRARSPAGEPHTLETGTLELTAARPAAAVA